MREIDIFKVKNYRCIVVDGPHILWLFGPYGRRSSLLCVLNDLYVVFNTIHDTFEFYWMNFKYNHNIYLYFLISYRFQTLHINEFSNAQLIPLMTFVVNTRGQLAYMDRCIAFKHKRKIRTK